MDADKAASPGVIPRSVGDFRDGGSLLCGDCFEWLVVVSANVSQPGRLLANFPVNIGIVWLPCGQTIDITIKHTERGCNQNRIVNLLVSHALLPRSFDAGRGHLLPAFLYFSSDVQERFHLGR
ncbi:MAG: hypothetical protein WBR26_17015 [Candidatus Acidiferrum sp.]